MVLLALVRTARPTLARSIAHVAPSLMVSLIIAVNLLLFYSRFVHSGRVCSGDYLDTKAESSKGYLIV